MDDDGSGHINYLEFEDMIRNELKISAAKLPLETIHAVWRALDEDKSGLLTSGEFGKFMRKGEHVHDRGDGWRTALSKVKAKEGADCFFAASAASFTCCSAARSSSA